MVVVSRFIYQKTVAVKFHVNGGIGLISSRILVEGPIVKDKGALIEDAVHMPIYF
jgi:hypothetical protein